MQHRPKQVAILRLMVGGTAFMLAACLAAAGARASPSDQAGSPAGTRTSELMGPHQAVRTSINPLWGVPLDALSATRERPIFSPTRRPPVIPAVVDIPVPKPPAPPPEPDHPLLSLIGTIVNGSSGIGIFVEPGKENALRLRTGQDHAGWVLQSVGAREASFAKGSRRAIVALPPRDASRAPPPASADLAGAVRTVAEGMRGMPNAPLGRRSSFR
jgi:general secretion pathway protein N